MKIQLLAAAAALAIAGCSGGQKEAEANASGNATAAATPAPSGGGSGGGSGGSVVLQPGEWETKVAVVSIDAPGMPKQVADMMASTMGGGNVTTRSCVTEEQARRPNADIFTGKQNGGCKSKDFSMSGGRLRGTIECPAPEGQPGSTTLAMDGQFSPQSYTINQNMTTDTGGVKMTIKGRVTGTRIGDCPAGAKAG